MCAGLCAVHTGHGGETRGLSGDGLGSAGCFILSGADQVFADARLLHSEWAARRPFFFIERELPPPPSYGQIPQKPRCCRVLNDNNAIISRTGSRTKYALP